jgi:hypothetical protein
MARPFGGLGHLTADEQHVLLAWIVQQDEALAARAAAERSR